MINQIQRIKNKFLESSDRSKETLVNIVLSLVSKGVSILSSLLIVPLTISYVNPTQYGIWLALSSIIGWISFFDLGLGNGFRNKFTEAKAKGEMELARQYVSTTYFAIGAIVNVVFIAVLVINTFVNWSDILNIDQLYSKELGRIFIILSAFFCLSMVAKLSSMLLTADQKVGVASLVEGGGQLASLISIYVLTKATTGSLTHLALYFAGIPCLVWVVFSFLLFALPAYRNLTPRLSNVRPKLIRNILGLGLQFFIIYLCLIVIFQMLNIVISRELGPDAVTEYNIAYKYFHVLNNVIIIILTPFWSAFTDAYTKREYAWMKGTVRKLEKLWAISSVGYLVMFVLSQPFYRLWIGTDVNVSSSLSLAVVIYFIIYNLGNIYMYVINGIGTIRIQLITYIIIALIAWPLMIFACESLGLVGIVVIPALTMLVQAVLGKIQLTKLLSHSAHGVWEK